MADYVVSAELELFISDFKKNITAAQNSLQDFEKQVKSVSESTKNGFDGKSLSSFSSKLENLGSKINKGTSAWGLDLGKFYDKGSSMFQSFGVDIDKFASHFGMSGKLMSAIVACVTALVKLGQEMDEARAEIVKGTGAIGDALDDLELSAKQALVKGVGTSVKETGKLIADLNTRFGYTGKVLEDTAVDFGKFAKAAGVDLNNAVNNVADVMARWNIPLGKSKDLMNQLTKASQVSGASVDELMSAVNTGSVYFEQFGFNLTESIAMLSSFRKNGIQTSTVMTGLRTALSKFSTEGKDAKTAFAEVTKQIKSATNETEAMNIAVSTFGARAGAEMFMAIRSGSASLEEFTEELRGAGYALDDTYDAVRTSKDAMNDLKNALKGTFGGLGQAFSALWKGILDGITEFVRFIEPIVTPIADVFKKVFSKIAEFISWFVKNLREAMQKNKVLWEGFIKVLNDVGKTLKSVFGDFVDIIKNVFGFIFSVIGGKWEEAWLHAQLIFYKFSRIVSKICDFIANIFVDLINFVGTKINEFLPRVSVSVAQVYENVKQGLPDWMVDWAEPEWFKMLTKVKQTAIASGASEEQANTATLAFATSWYEKSGTMFQKINKVALEEVKGAYGQMDKSLNDLIDEAEARLKVLENAKPGDIGDLSSIGGSDFGYGLGDDDESDEASKRSTAWIEKRLQQQLDAITAEKEARLSAMRDEGATQEELDAKNAEYAQNQILLYEKIQAFKKLADEQALGDIENLEEEKQNLVEYYADENAKYRISVETNTVKAIENIETESTAWKQKLLEQEISMIEYERKSSIELAKKEGQKIAEIKKMEEESIERQFKKYLELLNLKKKVDLESAKSEEEKADIEKYYGNDATSYLLNLYDGAMKETEEKTDSWWNKFKVIMNKVGEVVKKVVSKIVDVVKKGFELAWKVIQITPDDVLNNMLKFADTVQTFFTETLPQMPGLVDSLLNVIEVMVNSITTPETIQLLGNVLATILERTVSWLVDNIGLVLDGLGKLIGALIRELGSAIATIDWMELFGSIVTGLWNAITEILKALWDGLKEIFSSLGNWFRGIFESIGNWFRGIFESIGNWFKEFFQNIGKLFSKDNNSTGSHIAKGILGVLTGGISWIFTGFATGTNNADSGLHLVGEQGPELVDFHGGERVYNARETEKLLSVGGGETNNFNVNFYNTTDTSAYAMMRQFKQYQRQMAIDRIL